MAAQLRIARAVVGLAAVALTSSSAVQTRGLAAVPGEQDRLPLAPEAAIERELSTGQRHAYQLTATAGDFIKITVEQKGLDVVVTLLRPDGSGLLTVNASHEAFRPETLVAIADVNGLHTVDVHPAPSSESHGRYAIHVDELRASAPLDASRVEAERAFERGMALYDTSQPSAYRQSLGEFRHALDSYRALGDRRGEMKAAINIASAEEYLSMPEALASALLAEGIARELRDDAALATAVRVLGYAYENAGDRAAALRADEESEALSRAVGDARGVAASLMNAGTLYGKTGNAEQAVVRFEQALQLTHEGSRSADILLNNLGIAYKDLGRFDKALAVYEQSLARVRARSDSNLEAVILNNMGNVHRLLGHHDRALDVHARALVLSRESGGKANEARSLNTLGQTYFALGDFMKALQYHRDALAIRRELADLPGQASSLDGAGRTLHRLGESEKALEALREALTIRRAIREQYAESDTLRNLAEVERDRGHLAEALSYIEAAVDLDETLRARITSPEVRSTYVAAEQNTHELFIDVLQRLHAADPAGGHGAMAFQASERARARVLLESLLDARVDLREGIDPVLLEREQTVQKQLREASTQLSRSLSRNSREESTRDAQRLERLTSDYQRLQGEIRQRSPRYAAVTQPRPLEMAEIQRSVLDDDTVLLEFALGEDRGWLWAVTAGSLTSVELPPRRAIDAAARSLYEQFTARQKRSGESSGAYAARVAAAEAQLGERARAVSRMLLGGIARQLNDEWRSKRLAIVAAGALEYLPFAALPTPDPVDDGAAERTASPRRRLSDRPLAFQHEIVTVPSASVLAVLRRETANRIPAVRTLAILADPVFDANDPRVASLRVPQAPAVGDDRASRAVDLMDSLYGRSGLSRLPFSREEADAIAAIAGTTRAWKAIDFKASRATATSGALSGHRIVHFATHGILDSERPALSALVLSLVDERGARQNGYLRLHDIYNMRLDAELVVLSACQTALGQEIKGEGLVGLTRAFFYAGAPRVVASLWEVNDLATAELMKKFYRGMLQRRLRPAAALRAAQLQMSQDPRWASPYYWAGFILQGEWR